MMKYSEMNKEQLLNELKKQRERYNYYQSKKLSYDMTRGKPAPEQLDLSNEMLDIEYVGDFKAENGFDCRNYGILDGLPEAKKLMGDIMGVDASKVIVCGNSSLNIMHNILTKFMLSGVGDGFAPWSKLEKVKFICPVPGYDRHFTICENLGIEMIPVELKEDGPDMDLVEKLVREDESIKGMWAMPRYSNPDGCTYSNETIKRIASMECKAKDFRVFFDDAYAVHFLEDGPEKILNIVDECEKNGNANRAFVFCSTSKITFAGGGISAVASSKANIEWYSKYLFTQTIGFDKLNQLRHVKFLKDYEGIVEHMKKHAKLLKPKFDIVLNSLEEELNGLDRLEWSKPKGGYFISINTLDGLADKVVSLSKDCGVMLTPAGSTFPYKKDPRNRNIRIAPSFPSVSDLAEAVRVLCVCVKICSLEYYYYKL
ncbi:MAG: aminotransferase class I/II-fold pyridoxal phosphate-dependent enzyme [Clostridiaceae bacterium]|nr:aminotransferase class I/II-fold pyridoxal phosphate-dependent enzyme [Clostridiaceae bacterium]